MEQEGKEKEEIRRDRATLHNNQITCVALVTVADNLSVTAVLVTRRSKVASTVGSVRARARTTLSTGCYAQNWVTIVTIGTPSEMTKLLTQVTTAVKGDTCELEWATCKKSTAVTLLF